MSGLKQTKIPMTLEENVLKVALEQNVIENEIFEHFRVEEKKITDATILLKEKGYIIIKKKA